MDFCLMLKSISLKILKLHPWMPMGIMCNLSGG